LRQLDEGTQDNRGGGQKDEGVASVKWLKASPQKRIEDEITEFPLLHACCGKQNGFGTITLDIDPDMHPTVIGDVRNLPFKSDSFAAAFMDCPWTAGWKKNISLTIKELLRVAPIVYVLSPWIYGSSICKITEIKIAWQPGVNQTLCFCKYERNSSG